MGESTLATGRIEERRLHNGCLYAAETEYPVAAQPKKLEIAEQEGSRAQDQSKAEGLLEGHWRVTVPVCVRRLRTLVTSNEGGDGEDGNSSGIGKLPSSFPFYSTQDTRLLVGDTNMQSEFCPLILLSTFTDTPRIMLY